MLAEAVHAAWAGNATVRTRADTGAALVDTDLAPMDPQGNLIPLYQGRSPNSFSEDGASNNVRRRQV